MAVRASDSTTLAVLPSPSYVRQFFLLQGSALAAPALPTTNPPAAPWSTVEPSYTAGSTNTLYTVMLTAYGSVSFEYGPVQQSSSYEAAKQAYNLAAAASAAANGAQSTADGKNSVYYQTTEPAGTAHKASDIWFDTDDGNKIYRWSGTAWSAAQLGSGAIENGAITGLKVANLDASSITTGFLTGARIAADAIDGKTITGALIRTAASGQRVEINGLTNAIDFYGATSGNPAVVKGFVDDAGGSYIQFSTTAGDVLVGKNYLPVGGAVALQSPSGWINEMYASDYYTMDGKPLLAKFTNLDTADLDNIVAQGSYECTSYTLATPARHYPIADAGNLEVLAAVGHTTQRYTTRNAQNGVWTRSRYFANAWSEWTMLARRGQDGVPFATAAGTAAYGSTLGAASGGNIAINFPSGRFTVAPRIIAMASTGRITCALSSISQYSCTIRADNNSTGSQTAFSIYWQAVQMTATSSD